MVDGKWGVLEVDGEQWHAGHAARDHERDRPFHFHGAKIVQRFDAGECFESADAVVAKFIALLKRS
jgi:very-short-patch-repair endonuclease